MCIRDRVLAKLYNGTRLWVNAQGSEWCQVTNQTNGMTGYVTVSYTHLDVYKRQP